MNRLLRDASIHTKVLSLVMLVTTVALVLASALFLTIDYRQFRIDTSRDLSTQARIVLENSTAAMSFQDQRAAQETLQTLSPDTHIRIGCLYDATGSLFAQYKAENSNSECPATPSQVDYQFGPNRIEVVARTQVAGQPAGAVYLESDLGAVFSRARVQALTALLVLGVSIVTALLLSTVLQRIISEPIDALAHTAREVSKRNDYSLRARKTTGDELGMLVDVFNGMLSQIQRAAEERAGLLAREREANRTKDEFLMTLSHELRTPLNAIQGWTQLLISQAVPADGVPNALQKIQRNVQSQAKLIEDLLDVSRFTTGKFRLDRRPIDLVMIVNQALETIRSGVEMRHIAIDKRFDAPTALLNGDPDRLQQVIWNLLSNAVKFSPSGSRIMVTMRTTGDSCELSVQDQGIGIDAAFLPHVFEPFRQADATTTRAHGGLGLGLSIAQRIVDLHGGEITAASPGVGQGSTFTIRLPLASIAESPGSRPPTGLRFMPADLIGVKVLVVDDDDDTRELLATLLGTVGARVYEASSVSEALRLAREVTMDVLISDIAMPDEDGYSLLSELRTMPNGSGPRIAIALTAQATPVDRERALAAGFDRHVAKPFDQDHLIEVLHEVLAASTR